MSSFHVFSTRLLKLEDTASRLEMTAQLAALYQELQADEIAPASYLMQGSLVPEYQRLEFQLSTKMVLRALVPLYSVRESGNQAETKISQDLFSELAAAEPTSAAGTADVESSALSKLTAEFKKMGDIGLVAENVLGRVKNQSDRTSARDLQLLVVFERLIAIAKESGSGSQQRKLAGLTALFEQVSPLSARYIARIVVGRLRLGFSTMTMIDALSFAKHGDKSDSARLEAAFNRRADIGVLARQYLKSDSSNSSDLTTALESAEVTLGIPVMPALCQRLNSASEIIDKMGEVFAEPKYDGLRIQIHFDRLAGTVTAHTRNLDDVTYMFPELQVAFAALSADRAILDGEAIGYDPATDSLRAFQETITRRRKHDVADQSEKIPMRFYIYDVMLVDDRSLIDEKLRTRKDVLKSIISDNDVFLSTPFIITNDPIELRTFHEEQLAAGFEGAVIKKVDSPYVSGRKGWAWVKIKEEEGTTGKLADTIDCLVMGYYSGRGKRTQFGLGALLVGVRESGTDQFLTVAKIGTGLTEAQLVELKNRCDVLSLSQVPPSYDIPKALFPDVVTEPALVVEIAADEITRSPLHSAGQALRFPRLIRIRDDKSPAEVTTVEELASLNPL